jgi:hypothetical protein
MPSTTTSDVESTERETIDDTESPVNESLTPSTDTPSTALPQERQYAPVTPTPQNNYAEAYTGQTKDHFYEVQRPMYPYPMGPNTGPPWASQGYNHMQYYPPKMGQGPYASAYHTQPPLSHPYMQPNSNFWNMAPWMGSGVQAPQHAQLWPMHTRAETTRTRKERAPKPRKVTNPVTPQQSTPQEGNLPSYAPRDEDRPNDKQPDNSDSEHSTPESAKDEHTPMPIRYAAGGGGGGGGDDDDSDSNSDDDNNADEAPSDEENTHEPAPSSESEEESRPRAKRHHSVKAVMQVKALEMRMTNITMKTIEEFRKLGLGYRRYYMRKTRNQVF